MNSTSEKNRLKGRVKIIVLILLLLLCFPGLTDGPAEKLYVPYNEINDTVLKNSIGALSLYVANTNPHEYFRKMLAENNEPPFIGLKRYKKDKEHFIRDGFIILEELKPISGWKYDDVEVMRFPIYAKQDNYRQIVYNARKNLTAWINLDTIRPHWFYSSHKELYFNNDTKEYKYVEIDILNFTSTGVRKIYKEPSDDSDSFEFSRQSYNNDTNELIQKIAEHSFKTGGDFTMIEIKNGFISIVILEGIPYETIIRWIGWIKIRDSENRFTIWPTCPMLPG